MFSRFFGGGKSSSHAPQQSSAGVSNNAAGQAISAIQNLADKEEQLEKRKVLLEKKLELELQKARDFNKAAKKSQALMCLKRKKMYEGQMENVDNQILRLSEQRMMLESAQTTAQAVSAMSAAAHAQQAIHSELKIENVDQVMDEIQDANDQMQMVNEALAGPLNNQFDEDDLLNELDEMDAEQLDAELLEPAPVPTAAATVSASELPSAPTGAATVHKTQEELELEALTREMGLEAA